MALLADAGSKLVETVKAELALARHELEGDLDQAQVAAVELGGAAACAVIGLELLLGAMIVAGRRHPLLLASTGVGALGVAAVLAVNGRRSLPRMLERTKRRATADAARIAEELK